MAVYTNIDKQLLESFLQNYDLGKLLNFEGIQEGVENSNFKLIMSSGLYILTIFEKRVDEMELPFFIQLKKHLVKKNFLCPKPIVSNKGSYINTIKNKPSVINSFLKGQKLNSITENHCQQLGKQLSYLHIKSNDFKLSRQNNLSQKYWRNLFENFRYNKKTEYNNLFEEINTEIDFLEKNWPKNLPSGIIHADIFQDNVFFNNDIFSGIIDFYFACNDYYAYELAICLNAWCFNSHQEFDTNKSATLLNSYQNQKKLSDKEKQVFPILLRGAAMRFLLTRLNDFFYQQKEAYVNIKDPMEYVHILNFHQKNSSLSKIGF